MFEVKDTGNEVQMIGTFVDVFEFADRWNKFSTFQKSVLKSHNFVGTYDEFSLNLGYSAPMATMYRKQLYELVEIGLVQIADFDKEYYEEHKEDFDDYDFAKKNKISKVTKLFFIPYPADVANRMLAVPSDRFPEHSSTGPIQRKGRDYRVIANEKRRKPTDGRKKIPDEIRVQIQKEYAEGETCQSLGDKYGVTKQTISNILKENR